MRWEIAAFARPFVLSETLHLEFYFQEPRAWTLAIQEPVADSVTDPSVKSLHLF